MNNNIDKFYWHDGVIEAYLIDYSSGEGDFIQIIVSAYETNSSSNRTRFAVKFYNVSKTTVTCDFFQLRDNSNAGNITDAHFSGSTFVMYLIDGYLEVQCQRMEIEEFGD